MGKQTISHRYDYLPLLTSAPGGFERSWSYRTYPSAKVVLLKILCKFFPEFFYLFFVNGLFADGKKTFLKQFIIFEKTYIFVVQKNIIL